MDTKNQNTPQEGPVAKNIEAVTSRVPSDVFLWTAIGAISLSLAMKLMKKSHLALFFGQWVSPFLLMGIYNKIVKTNGHDRKHRNPRMFRK